MGLGYDSQPPQPILFEPLAEAELKVQTWKMVFLVTMAPVARSSEVNALSFTELSFEDNYKFAVSSNVLKFQPKGFRSISQRFG